MRISDWSSDVCSSDLLAVRRLPEGEGRAASLACHHDRLFGRPHHHSPRSGHNDLARRDICACRRVLHLRHRSHHPPDRRHRIRRSEEHTSELQSLMRISYAVFCLKKKNKIIFTPTITITPSSLT